MSDYVIKVPSKTQALRHPKLRGLKFGPVWNKGIDPDWEPESDASLRKKTKSPIVPRKRAEYRSIQRKKHRQNNRRHRDIR